VSNRDDIKSLMLDVSPLSPVTTVAEAGEVFLRDDYARMLSLPVVDEGRPVGLLSRYQLIQIFLKPFGREIFGRRPVSAVMNPRPLTIALDQSLEAAAQYVAANIAAPITEDFIITGGGSYLGMGVVLDLLRAMESRVALSSARLGEAYRQLKSSQAQLVQNEKMASLGQMVAGVAHEINTPLGYVRNNVEMVQMTFQQVGGLLDQFSRVGELLQDDKADEVELSRLLSEATSGVRELRQNQVLEDTEALLKDTFFGVDQIKELVINLRNFSRLDQAKVAEVSVNDCLDQTLSIANNVLKNKVEVIKRYGEVPRIACSPSQINQVLLNLMTNAAQAIEHDAGKLLLKTEADAAFVHISIQDNGKGIPTENLRKIFDPFFTTKAIGQGTGLGLSISFQIVQAHGGTIKVASVPGKGTRFLVSLPIAQAAQPAVIAVAA
jgi:signal transduction histidine kinase